MCKCSSLFAGAEPTSCHFLGTLWVSLTAYSVRERRGELRIQVEAARRPKETERRCISILDTLYWEPAAAGEREVLTALYLAPGRSK